MYSLLIENDRTLKNYQDSRENHKDANLIRVFHVFKHLSNFWFPFCVPEPLTHDQNLTKQNETKQKTHFGS